MFSQRIVEYDCYFCDVCRDYVYDESVGDPYIGIVAKTRVENLPLWWKCPKCGASKESLRASTLFEEFNTMIFNDRSDAGKQLALAVERSLFQGAQRVLKGNTLVVGLPRGGVPVALEVAQRLECPLQIIVSKKLPYPGQPEYAIGAVSSDGLLVLNPEIPQDQKWKDYIEQQRRTLLEKTLQMEEVFYRIAGIEKTSFDGKTIIIVDDGIATGMTAIAAAETARFRRAKKIITAAPIMSLDSYEKLKRHCDQVIAIRLESSFRSVSQFYRNFEQTSNDEVVAALRASSSLAQDCIYPRQARVLNHSGN